MKHGLITLVLAALLLSSAVGVVVSKHQSRALHARLAELSWERDRLAIEWDQLQLEEATLAAHARVERQARARLTMAEPTEPDTATLLIANDRPHPAPVVQP